MVHNTITAATTVPVCPDDSVTYAEILTDGVGINAVHLRDLPNDFMAEDQRQLPHITWRKRVGQKMYVGSADRRNQVSREDGALLQRKRDLHWEDLHRRAELDDHRRPALFRK
ncbi:hypothetical protein AU252_01125 [Pseudarthrobacter sulfonivorans]|uniref:Uncharacterized protein n=1 Tax=Pseudarthrobacter sulfonivorans TaxID=121292 RepID=A0A0U3P3M2_9MICC|nr:hypothetical protein AU252_01125 [Pseudarthrobacter sulfonivorans]